MTNGKKLLISAFSIGSAIAGALLLKNNPKTASKVMKTATDFVKEPEQTFGSDPLSQLTELAKQCYHGISCTVDQWGFLIFHHKSNRGHQTFHTQMMIDATGKLVNLGGHYPGQWKSTADTFAEMVNNTFKLKK